MRKAYAEFDYKTVVASLSAFMNTELSAFYFDIRKDTLYCDPPSSLARKAALTAIDIICDAILKWLAPVLCFTTEEAWRMYRPDAEPSVHLTLFPEELRRLPRRRAGREMGDHPRRPPRRHRRAGARARRQEHRLLAGGLADGLCLRHARSSATLFDVDLAEVCITSNADVRPMGDAPGRRVPFAERARRRRRGRESRRHQMRAVVEDPADVGSDAEYPDVSPRDAQALREWKALGVSV